MTWRYGVYRYECCLLLAQKSRLAPWPASGLFEKSPTGEFGTVEQANEDHAAVK
jgi:hypothetical protein